MLGTDIIKLFSNKTGSAREQEIARLLDMEALPAFLDNMKPITVTSGGRTLVYYVMPDFLCLGQDTDFFHIPMTPPAAKSWMQKNNFSLPTKTMANQIFKQCEVKVRPFTFGSLSKEVQNLRMENTAVYVDQSKKIQAVIGSNLGKLIAGHKKDVVLSNGILAHPHNVAIYGWFDSRGKAIQGLNYESHVVGYVDYSHGLRMVSNVCYLDGVETSLQKIWSDPVLCTLIHDEILRFQSY
jgi:hypothetical protein